MKKAINTILSTFVLACFTGASAPHQPLGNIGPFVFSGGMTVGVVYTKAQVVAMYGNPDEYSEWDADSEPGNDVKKAFLCVYEGNEFYFYPVSGLRSFVLESNDIYIDNLDILIGDTLEDFINAYLPYTKKLRSEM